jgi:hypothetical protein
MFARLGVALKHQLDPAALLELLPCKLCRKSENFRADHFSNVSGCIRMLCLAPDAPWHNDIDLSRTLQLEQPFNQQVVGRAIPIQGIVIERDVAFPWIQWTTRHAQLQSRSLPTRSA